MASNIRLSQPFTNTTFSGIFCFMPRFEQESVQSCVAYDRLHIDRSQYPWIVSEETTIPTFLVALHDGTQFRFGSLIGLNTSIEKLADSVRPRESASTQAALFMGLPSVLQGQPASGISKVENSNLKNNTLFIASRNLVTAAGLVFAIQNREGGSGISTVLRAGISSAKLRPRLLSVMGIQQAGGKRRQA